MSSDEICDALIWKTDSFSNGKKIQYLLFIYVKINDEYYYHTIFDEHGSDYIGACSKKEHEKMISESEKFLHLTESEFVAKFESTTEIYNSTIAFAKRQIEKTKKNFEDDTENMKKYLLKNYVVSYLHEKSKEKMDEFTKLSIEILKINAETKEKTKNEIDHEKIIEENRKLHNVNEKVIIKLANETVKESIVQDNNVEIKNDKNNKNDDKNMEFSFDSFNEFYNDEKNMKNPFELNGFYEENKLEIKKICFNIIKEAYNIIIKLENNEIDEDTFKKMCDEIKKKYIAELMENKSIKKYINNSPYGEYINSYLHLYCDQL
jgi:hypothetical protein